MYSLLKGPSVTKVIGNKRATCLIGAATLVAALSLSACSKKVEPTTAVNRTDAAGSADSALVVATVDAAKLCKVLNELAPQAPSLSALGTQAQLVMAIASAFDTNPEALRIVSAEIDAVAIASCPAARDALLKVLKMNSLREAVR